MLICQKFNVSYGCASEVPQFHRVAPLGTRRLAGGGMSEFFDKSSATEYQFSRIFMANTFFGRKTTKAE